MPGSRAARWSSSCAPSPTSTPTRTRSSAPACAPTSSAAAATGPSSRSPTSARCWRRSPTHSTTRRCSAPSPRRPAACARTRSGCCGRRPGRGRHVWPAIEHLTGAARSSWLDPERLDAIAGAESRAAAAASRRPWRSCGDRAPRLPLAELIDTAVDLDRLRPGGADAAIRRGPVRQRPQADAARGRVRGRRGPRPARPARLPRGARGRGRRRRRRRPRSRATTASGS